MPHGCRWHSGFTFQILNQRKFLLHRFVPVSGICGHIKALPTKIKILIASGLWCTLTWNFLNFMQIITGVVIRKRFKVYFMSRRVKSRGWNRVDELFVIWLYFSLVDVDLFWTSPKLHLFFSDRLRPWRILVLSCWRINVAVVVLIKFLGLKCKRLKKDSTTCLVSEDLTVKGSLKLWCHYRGLLR